ncbi:MAG: hypothetical protein WCQ91_02385 [Planctomycetota bacterium]
MAARGLPQPIRSAEEFGGQVESAGDQSRRLGNRALRIELSALGCGVLEWSVQVAMIVPQLAVRSGDVAIQRFTQTASTTSVELPVEAVVFDATELESSHVKTGHFARGPLLIQRLIHSVYGGLFRRAAG